jgi:hypothetical protein
VEKQEADKSFVGEFSVIMRSSRRDMNAKVMR